MTLCVYCGSSSGSDSAIPEMARKFGRLMGKNGHSLVYGGSSLGIMGILADSVMLHGGRVTGVIPENLFSREVAHQGISHLITVRDMHERKSQMAELSDAFVALPGGFGTLEELFEIITWNQIGIIDKPVTILNKNGYFDFLIKMIDHAVESGFIKSVNREILQVAETIEECLELSLKS